MSLFGGLFTKDIKNTSSTTNEDNSRVNTLTDSLNTSIQQNLALTKAENRTFNSAFDAIDSFNSVSSFEIANLGGGPASIPTLDFTGLRSLFTNPADLKDLINSNHIDADPNANKYNFDFSAISAGGNDFLKSVQGMVQSTWDGLSQANASQQTSPTTNIVKYLAIAAVAIAGIWMVIKLLKR